MPPGQDADIARGDRTTVEAGIRLGLGLCDGWAGLREGSTLRAYRKGCGGVKIESGGVNILPALKNGKNESK